MNLKSKKTKLINILIFIVLLVIIFVGCDNQADTKPEDISKIGIDDWKKEVISDKPGETQIRYYVIEEDGQEVDTLVVNAMTEEHDLDDDGFQEIVVYIQGDKRGIGIYDIISDELQYIDVNKKLVAVGSEYMGNIGNVKLEYSNYIEVEFEESNKSRYEVYRYGENTLEYVMPFDDALRK